MAALNKQAKFRLLIVTGFFTLGTLLLIGRAVWLQLVMGEQYQLEASKQQFSGKLITPERGTIYDRNGNELAINLPVVTVWFNPSLVNKAKIGVDAVALKLADILKVDKAEILKKLGSANSYEVVKRKVDESLGTELKTWVKENKVDGIYIDADTKRYYPDNNLASQLIGFSGIDNQGLSGMEVRVEQYLKGVPGKITSQVDPLGREIPFTEEGKVEAQNGLNVVLTIDENIQKFAEDALQNAINQFKALNGGTAVVMDPRTGEVLAMVSKPDFNLNDPYVMPVGVTGLDQKIWAGLSADDKVKKLQETAWRNKVVNSTYEPGSPFKVITAAAGIEEGLITPETEVMDAPIKVAGYTINCWKAGGHGRESFREAVYNSCSPVFAKLSQSMGIDRFYQYVRSFGFYDKTLIDIAGEETSVIHKQPTEIDMVVASFGQCFQVTPIQVVTAYSAIANGGKLMKPQLIKELTDRDGNIVKKYEPQLVRNVISEQTASTLREMLEGVVSKGTGTNAYVKGYRVAGKSGTSETFEDGARGGDRYIASFAALAPADNPVICVLVTVDHPSIASHSGGFVAGPVAGNIIENTLEYLGVERRYNEKDESMMALDVWVPELKGKTIAEALSALSMSGLKPRFEYGEGGSAAFNADSKVVEQSPKSTDSLPSGSTVTIYTYKPGNEINVAVPDLSRKTVAEASRTLAGLGLNIRVKGKGSAAKQSIEPGKLVPMGSAVQVEFK